MKYNIKIDESVKKQFELKEKNAVITGGCGFLGSQFAETISEMGGNPIIIDNDIKHIDNLKNKLKKFGVNNLVYYSCDITSENQVKEVLKDIKKKISQLTYLLTVQL